MNLQPFPIITFGQPGIKYWDEIETEIKEPPEEREGMFLNKLNEVLTQKEAAQFVKALRKEEVQLNIPSYYERGALERNAYLEKGFVYHRITFNENEVDLTAFENNINPYEGFSEKVQANILKILKRLCKEYKWENSVKLISCIATEYLIKHAIEQPLNDTTWHSDRGEYHYRTYTGELTTIILLSDPDDKNNGWEGGELSYTGAEGGKLSFVTYSLDWTSKPKRNWPIWSINQTYLDGISFGNWGMLHKVGKLSPKVPGQGKRFIFIVNALHYNSRENRRA